MKREIFLSFKPEFFRPILYDIKKYEYRKRFCKEATTAYLYLSAPIQEVIGIMELGVPVLTKDVVLNYVEGTTIRKRTQHCIDVGELFAIPIESLQLFKNPVPVSKIKELDLTFRVPRCYLNIAKYDKAYEYLKSQEMFDIEFYNAHETLYEDNFGITCKEMEIMAEFEEKNYKYTQNSKYNIIRCGYLNEKYNKRSK